MLMTSAETESKNEIKNTRFKTFNVIAIWGHFFKYDFYLSFL